MAKEVIGLDNILIIASFFFYDHRHYHLDGSVCCLSMVSIAWSDVHTGLPQPVQVSHMWLAYEMPLLHDLQRHAGSQSVRSVAQIPRSQCYFSLDKKLCATLPLSPTRCTTLGCFMLLKLASAPNMWVSCDWSVALLFTLQQDLICYKLEVCFRLNNSCCMSG